MNIANTAKKLLALLRNSSHLDKEFEFNTPEEFERKLSWRQNNCHDEPEGAWRGYGERGLIEPRPEQGTTIIIKQR